jgi:putative SOS response-associated peptidase YedK
MCGRYELIDGQRIFIRFKVANAAPEVAPNLDVRPTQHVPVLLPGRELTLMKWGLVPVWAKDMAIGNKMINARAEGIEDKPSFKRPLRTKRCLLPASAYFEWQGAKGAKVKYRIARADGDMLALAGLYDDWKSPSGDVLRTCTIITCAPSDTKLAAIHDRMPVILLPEDEDAWLDPEMTDVGEIKSYLRPSPAGLLEAVKAA